MNASAGAVMIMLSPEEFRRTIADAVSHVVAEQLRAQREESQTEREHTEQMRELESPGLTVAQTMKRLGFTDRRAFFASVKRIGLTYSQPSPRKIFFHPDDVEDAIERARTMRR